MAAAHVQYHRTHAASAAPPRQLAAGPPRTIHFAPHPASWLALQLRACPAPLLLLACLQDGLCDKDCYPPSKKSSDDWSSRDAVCASGITYMNNAEAKVGWAGCMWAAFDARAARAASCWLDARAARAASCVGLGVDACGDVQPVS